MRALISYKEGAGSAQCAELTLSHMESLTGDFHCTRITSNTKVFDFQQLIARRRMIRPEWSQSSWIENYELVIHFGHGNNTAFALGRPHSWNVHENAVEEILISHISPGEVNTRYLWLLACNTMEHGDLPAQPHLFRGSGPNAFCAWGCSYEGLSPPLRGGVRFVGGGSTVLSPRPHMLAPVFRLIREGGFRLADSFILGLTTETQTPMCVALGGTSATDSPLWDDEWSTERNAAASLPTGSAFIHIQYPVIEEFTGESYDLGSSPPPELSSEAKECDSLPCFELARDQQALQQMREMAALLSGRFSGDNSDFRAAVRFDEASATLVIRVDRDIPSGAGSEMVATELLQYGLHRFAASLRRNFVQSSRLDYAEIRNWQVRLVIDMFPEGILPCGEAPDFPLSALSSTPKSRFQVQLLSLKDVRAPENTYQILDPDHVCIIEELGYVASSESPRSVQLMLRGLTLEDSTCSAIPTWLPVCDHNQAKQRARERLAYSSTTLLERLDTESARVSVGYRRYPCPERLGALLPHYLVRFPARTQSEGVTGFTVEVEAAADL